MLGPGPNRSRCGAWRGVYDFGITLSVTTVHSSPTAVDSTMGTPNAALFGIQLSQCIREGGCDMTSSFGRRNFFGTLKKLMAVGGVMSQSKWLRAAPAVPR